MIKISVCRPATVPKVYYDMWLDPLLIMGIIMYTPPQIYLVNGEVYVLNPVGITADQLRAARADASLARQTQG